MNSPATIFFIVCLLRRRRMFRHPFNRRRRDQLIGQQNDGRSGHPPRPSILVASDREAEKD
jgi:hypothetical protein